MNSKMNDICNVVFWSEVLTRHFDIQQKLNKRLVWEEYKYDNNRVPNSFHVLYHTRHHNLSGFFVQNYI